MTLFSPSGWPDTREPQHVAGLTGAHSDCIIPLGVSLGYSNVRSRP